MALDLQKQSAQHDHRRHHTRYETENGCVVLQAGPIENGGITRIRSYAATLWIDGAAVRSTIIITLIEVIRRHMGGCMREDQTLETYMPPPHPRGVELSGQLVRLEPLDVGKHSEDLFHANSLDRDGSNWTYLPYGPFSTLENYQTWLTEAASTPDPYFFAIIKRASNKAVGLASYLRIKPEVGSIEVGHINYSPLLQQTREGTEAMFLLMKWAFDSGYRRYEWKCNALNTKSRNAAQRLGLSYEGVFRQMSISKGRNRNTVWFAAIDKEWPTLKTSFETYLAGDNFNAHGRAKQSLSGLTKPLLYKHDTLEFGFAQV